MESMSSVAAVYDRRKHPTLIERRYKTFRQQRFHRRCITGPVRGNLVFARNIWDDTEVVPPNLRYLPVRDVSRCFHPSALAL